jgi:hypothetical protein
MGKQNTSAALSDPRRGKESRMVLQMVRLILPRSSWESRHFDLATLLFRCSLRFLSMLTGIRPVRRTGHSILNELGSSGAVSMCSERKDVDDAVDAFVNGVKAEMIKQESED